MSTKQQKKINCTRCGKELGLNYYCSNCDENKITQFKSACINKIENWHGDTYKELIYIHDAIEIIEQTAKEYENAKK